MDLGPGWLPENLEALADLIAQRGKGGPAYDPAHPPHAVFDWDNTCLAGDLGDAFFYGACTRRAPPFADPALWDILTADDERDALLIAWQAAFAAPGRAARATIDALRWQLARSFRLLSRRLGDRAYGWQTQILAGMTPNQVEALSDLILEEESRRPLGKESIPAPDGRNDAESIPTGLRLYPQIGQLRMRLEGAGIATWVITATSEVIVRAGAHRLGFAHERVIGMRNTTVNGRLTSTLKEPNTWGEGKITVIRRDIHPTQRPILVVADGLTDRDMLEYGADVRLVIDRSLPYLREQVEAGRKRGERWLVQPPFPVAERVTSAIQG
ncbi:MAG: haloacid dehalogenase-like hydrolase [Anaerolineae bacterium]|nr:haloacid dehalogenase-like hydrolase [Anaerolineae bacterium]